MTQQCVVIISRGKQSVYDPTLHTWMTTVQLLASFYPYFIFPGIESFPMHTNIYNLRVFSCHSCQNSIWHCTRCNNQEWYMHLIFSFQEEITIFEKKSTIGNKQGKDRYRKDKQNSQIFELVIRYAALVCPVRLTFKRPSKT